MLISSVLRLLTETWQVESLLSLSLLFPPSPFPSPLSLTPAPWYYFPQINYERAIPYLRLDFIGGAQAEMVGARSARS